MNGQIQDLYYELQTKNNSKNRYLTSCIVIYDKVINLVDDTSIKEQMKTIRTEFTKYKEPKPYSYEIIDLLRLNDGFLELIETYLNRY